MLIEKGKPVSFYGPHNAVDESYKTSWCAGAGKGAGEWIKVAFKPTAAGSVNVLNGYGRTMGLYLANNRVKDYELIATARDGKITKVKGTFPDSSLCLRSEFVLEGYCSNHGNTKGTPQWRECMRKELLKECKDVMGNRPGDTIELGSNQCLVGFELKILSVYPGTKYKDTCIGSMELSHEPVNRMYSKEPLWHALVESCSAKKTTGAGCNGELMNSLCWRNDFANDLDWNSARDFCKRLDGRLPTKAELEMLTQGRALPKVLSQNISRVGKYAGFWTSTEHGADSAYLWPQDPGPADLSLGCPMETKLVLQR